jgi:hypothetical protein
MKKYKQMSSLEKIGFGLLALPLWFPLLGIFMALMILYDGFILQQIWNLLVPKLFGLPQLTLIAAIVINIIAAYIKFSGYKEKTDYKSILITPLMFWLVAWIVSHFI